MPSSPIDVLARYREYVAGSDPLTDLPTVP
jgi:hypothetical protein